ncbi:hypothetical protein ET009_07120 [Lactococcus garvieae]|nr:hypothetical protein [Lactococcus garvieae]
MNREQKKKLGVLAVLGLALLVGGTFAFRAFEQQAINDREREHDVNVGGRVHDYYNRDTENKDVFIENYSERPIMARIRLSEYLETRQRNVEDFTPLVSGTSRENVGSWTRWIPSATNINDRANNNASNAFDRYSELTFGWSREEQSAPWYLPTFNQDNLDQRTASAGHARDWIAGSGAVDGITDGTTHPGEGTDDFWSSGISYTNGSEGTTWPGSATATRITSQNLQQERPPMTIQQWGLLPNENRIGNFWVIDHQTGGAYWANRLEAGEATSYLLDEAKVLDEAIEESVFNGYSYYGINVESDLVSPEQKDEFLDDGEDHHIALESLLTAINSGIAFEVGQNPLPNDNSTPSEFNFSSMRPGRVFTMAGVRYRYLKNMGSNNHMILSDSTSPSTIVNIDTTLDTWFTNLNNSVQNIARPISRTLPVPNLGSIQWVEEHHLFLPSNLDDFPDAASDLTTVATSGSERAFALSFADVVSVSGENLAFPNTRQRVLGSRTWWTRTPNSSLNWLVNHNGNLVAAGNHPDFHIRPALIINNGT